MKWSWFPLQHKSIISTVKLSEIMEQSVAQAYIPYETETWDLTEHKSEVLPFLLLFHFWFPLEHGASMKLPVSFQFL
jgi:hypothetical protein